VRVLSLGAGVQSSTIALMAAAGELPMPDCAIFADVQSEPDSVYRWLDWLEQQLPFPVYRVTRGILSEECLIVKTSKNNTQYVQHSPPLYMKDNSTGETGIMMRQCTSNFKIRVIIQKLRELGGKKSGVEQLIGISMDEIQRMKPARDKWITNVFPLIDKRMSRGHCLEWLKDHGYPEPPRSSCWFCPYHSAKEWQRLKTDEPESFAKAVKFEKDFQEMVKQIPGFRGTSFLHNSCKSLNSIDFEHLSNSRQIDLFNNECEGMCGL
jgi:hypothetical protein